MENFDMTRFGKAMKWTLLANKKDLVKFAFIMTIIYMVIQIALLINTGLFMHTPSQLAIYSTMGFCQSAFAFSCLYCLTAIFQNVKTKQERIAFFTMPFSMPEKYVSRLLYCCIVMPLASYLGLIAATATRLLIQFVFRHTELYIGLVSPIHIVEMPFDMPVNAAILLAAMTAWWVSLFILGGSFFRKQPLAMTLATIFAFFILFGWPLGYLIGHLAQMVTIQNETLISLIITLLFLLFTVFNLWYSYRLFKCMQVVQHKWFNV